MIHIIHQFLILVLVHDGNDLVSFLHIISTDGFIDRRPAMKSIEDKIAEFLLLFRNDTHTAFDIMIKNKMI